MQTNGFVKEGNPNRLLGEFFNPPLQTIFTHYPSSKSVTELSTAFNSKKYTNLALAVEAEHLGHRLEDTISLEDVAALNKIALTSINNMMHFPVKSNLEIYLKELCRKSVDRSLQVDNISQLVNNYRYAVASKLIIESPDLKEAANIRIKEMIEALPEDQRLEHLKALLRPQVFQDKYNLKSEFTKIITKYDGHIENPEFRNWIIDQYSTILANQVGLDDGSAEYYQ